MTRLNSRQRKRIFHLLVERDGEKCKICKRKPPNEIKKLVIDRIYNQGDYKDLKKLQLLCYRCNYQKNPRKKEREPLDQMCVGVREEKKKVDLNFATSISINREKEPLFCPYLDQRLEESPDGVDSTDIIYSSAWVLELSPRTTEKYLKTACSSAGPYELVKDGKITLVRKK